MPMPSFTRGEMALAAEMLHLLVCYLDAVDRPDLAEPAPDVHALAASAAVCVAWACTPSSLNKPQIGSGLIIGKARTWLTGGQVHPDRSSTEGLEPGGLFTAAGPHVRAMCPVDHRDAALELLNLPPLYAERLRQRRLHPVRAWRDREWPSVVGLDRWRPSLWDDRVQGCEDGVAVLHASAGIATAAWSNLDVRRNPVGVREDLRAAVSRLREGASTFTARGR